MTRQRSGVVLVHGLWMTGVEMIPLARALRRAGYRVKRFTYTAVFRDLRQNAARLRRFASKLGDGRIHFVGHSLGGLLIWQMYQDFGDLPAGRAVALGTPFNGSWTAARVRTWPVLGPMLGRTLRAGMKANPKWDGMREFGVIAGTYPLGAGSIIGGIPKPNDGTVTVAETKLAGATDHVAVRVNHVGLLGAPRVHREVAHFLEHGRFAGTAGAPDGGAGS